MVTLEPIKIVCWDLDGTLWAGTLEEDGADATVPLDTVKDIIIELDRRGILNSIVSQASADKAHARLAEHGLEHLFIYPQFDVGSKAQAIAAVLDQLHLLPAHAAFVDDLAFHRAEVAELLSEVMVVAPEALPIMLDHPRFQVTSALGVSRRRLYQEEETREAASRCFIGSRSQFLQSCEMKLTCREARKVDQTRLMELFSRAHRLNSIPANESKSAENTHEVVTEQVREYVACLRDRFGDYGLIAGATLRQGLDPLADQQRVICERLAVSCRVQGRGVLEAFLTWLVQQTPGGSGLIIPVDISSDVNRPLRMALRFCGWAPVDQCDTLETLGLVRRERMKVPEWIQLIHDSCATHSHSTGEGM